jgi:formylglycine-generating enzyme required for sulfatase activity
MFALMQYALFFYNLQLILAQMGGWGYPPVRCRVAFRSYDSPDYVYGTHGFRLAMTAQ